MDNLRLDIEWDVNEPELKASMDRSRKSIEGVGQTVDEVESQVSKTIQQFHDKLSEISLTDAIKPDSKAIQAAFSDLEKVMGSELKSIMDRVLDDAEANELSSTLQTVSGDFERIQLVVGTLATKIDNMPDLSLVERDEMYSTLEAIMNFSDELNELSKDVPLVTADLKKLKDAMAELELQGKANTEEYNQLKEAAIQLQEAINNTNQVVKSAASTTQYIDTAVRGMQSLIAAYNIAQGAAALLGKDNDDLQKGILRITAAISILQGLQQIQLELKRKDNILTTTQTLLQRGYAIAVGQSTGAMKAFRLALLGTGIGAFIVGIGLLIEYIQKLRTEQEKAREHQEKLNEALSTSKNAVAQAQTQIMSMRTSIRAAQEGIRSKTNTLKEYNDGLGKTFGQAKSLDEAEQLLVKHADKYIEVTMAKARAMAVAELAAKKYAEIIETQVRDEQEFIASDLSSDNLSERSKFYLRRLANKRREEQVEELRKDYDAYLEVNGKLEREYLQKVKDSGLNFDDTQTPKSSSVAENLYQRMIDSRRDALNKVVDLNREYLRKSMSSDEAELQAIRDKFDKVRRILEEENEKIAKYNKANKNTPVSLIDISSIDPIEKRATDDLIYRQSTDKLIKAYEMDFELYKQYQAYKKEVGQAAADEEYVVNLDKINNFYENLRKEVESLWDKIADGSATDLEKERFTKLKELDTQFFNASEDERRQMMAELLKNYLTFEEKRQKIIDDSEKKITEYTKAGLLDRADEVRKARDQELMELNVSTVESLGGIDGLLDKMDDLSYKAQVEGIRAAKRMFEEWIKQANLTEKEIEELRRVFGKFFKEADSRSHETLSNSFVELANGIGHISSTVSTIDEGFGRMLGTIADVVGGVQDIRDGIKKIQEAQKSGDGFAGLSGYMAIYGAMVQAGTGIFNAINAASEQRWNDQVMARTRELENQNRILEYQIALVDTLNGTDKLDKLKDNLVATKELLNQTRESLSGASLLSGNSRIDAFIKDLNSGKRDVKQLEAYLRSLQTQFDNTDWSEAARRANLDAEMALVRQALDFYSSSLKLTGNETMDELNKLYEFADDETRKQIDRIIELEKQLKELGQSISENTLGFSTKSMIDEIVSMFSQGKMSARDFTDNFESLMKKAIINSLSTRFLEKQLTEFYKQFEDIVARNAENGDNEDSPLTDDDIAGLRDKYDKIISNGQKQLDAWSKVTGLDFTSDSSGSLSSSGIERISEQSATEWIGIGRAQIDIQKQILLILQFGQEGFVQSLRHQAAIEQNTADTVTELKSAVTELKAINRNTGGKYGG